MVAVKSDNRIQAAMAGMLGINQIEGVLAPLRLGISASEVHGAMTGFLCAGGSPPAGDWLQTLQLQSADAAQADAARQPLAELATATAAAIRPENADLQLLLPAAGAELEARALGLVDWCRGFLGGFGLAGVDAEGMDPGMTGVLGDFADIATTVPDMGVQDEDRAALDELIRHVRFGALLLHAHLSVPEGITRQ